MNLRKIPLNDGNLRFCGVTLTYVNIARDSTGSSIAIFLVREIYYQISLSNIYENVFFHYVEDV